RRVRQCVEFHAEKVARNWSSRRNIVVCRSDRIGICDKSKDAGSVDGIEDIEREAALDKLLKILCARERNNSIGGCVVRKYTAEGRFEREVYPENIVVCRGRSSTRKYRLY